MSTSLWVWASGPPDAADAVVAIDRGRGDLAAVDRDLATLRGPWPQGPLCLYRRGRSSRGVEVGFDGERFTIRLLALSSPGDYELAFRLVEVLGAGGVVEGAVDAAIPARDVAARLGGWWVERDRALGLLALRRTLATGGAVTVRGPVRSIEVTPGAMATTSGVDVIEELRRAQLVEASAPAGDRAALRLEHDDERRDREHHPALAAEEAAMSAPAHGRARVVVRTAIAIALVGVTALPALIVRLLTWPLRGRLRDRRRARDQRRRDRVRDGWGEAAAALGAAPDDVDSGTRSRSGSSRPATSPAPTASWSSASAASRVARSPRRRPARCGTTSASCARAWICRAWRGAPRRARPRSAWRRGAAASRRGPSIS